MKSKNKISGFTLIEIAIVIAVAGLILSGSIYAYKLTMTTKPIQVTRANFEIIELAMSKFLALHGRLPCPAKPELREEEADAGVESCYEVGITPLCNNSLTSSNGAGLCAEGGRDADGDTLADQVVIGSVPYTTLGLTYTEGNDGRFRKIKYVVTDSLTDAATYDEDLGAIYIVNPLGVSSIDGSGVISPSYKTATPPDALNGTFPYPYGSGQFYLMSFGKNNISSYVFTSGGGLANRTAAAYQCDRVMTESSPFFGLDFENCNNDTYFFSSTRYAVSDAASNMWYLDDIIHTNFRVKPYEGGEWQYSGTVTNPEEPVAVRVKNSSARVGIGTDKPSATMEVNGNMKTDKIIAEKICDFTNNCFSPKILVGNGASACADGGGTLQGFKDGKPVCVNTTFTGINFGACPAEQVFQGVDSGKNIICN